MIVVAVFAALAWCATPQTFPVGTGLSMKQPAGSSVTPCPLAVALSAARAGATCQLQIYVSLDAGNVIVRDDRPITVTNDAIFAGTAGAQFAFYFGNTSTFDSTAMVAMPSGTYTQANVACPTGGQFYLGVSVTKCPLCILGVPAYYDLGLYYQIAGSVHIDIDPNAANGTLTSWVNVGSGQYVYFDVNITVAGSPHFTIQKCDPTCKTDVYDRYFGPQAGVDYTNTSQSMTYAVSVGATDEYMAMMQQPGLYTYVVFVQSVVGGSSTTFRLSFTFDTDAVSPSYPRGGDSCPTETCSSSLNCADCVKANCYWCPAQVAFVLLRMLVAGDTRRTQYACQSSEVCGTAAAPDNSMLMAMLGMNVTITTPPATNATAAANANNAVTDPDNCIDQDAYCKTLAHCTDCVGAKGCVWCNTLGGIGINTGSCSAGYQNNALQCSDLVVKPTTLAACPASNLNAAYAVVLAVVAAMIAMI